MGTDELGVTDDELELLTAMDLPMGVVGQRTSQALTVGGTRQPTWLLECLC